MKPWGENGTKTLFQNYGVLVVVAVCNVALLSQPLR